MAVFVFRLPITVPALYPRIYLIYSSRFTGAKFHVIARPAAPGWVLLSPEVFCWRTAAAWKHPTDPAVGLSSRDGFKPLPASKNNCNRYIYGPATIVKLNPTL